MMQIDIDTAKLPDGTTVQDVYDFILLAMHGHIDANEGPVDVDKEKAVMDALVDPESGNEPSL